MHMARGTRSTHCCRCSGLHLQVLSVVAQQLAAIQAALCARAAEVTIAQHSVPLAHSCGVFVTMNPGYADRAELPDNLQALFRPVTLSAPDSAIVAEAMLFWCGRMHLGVELAAFICVSPSAIHFHSCDTHSISIAVFGHRARSDRTNMILFI